MNESQSIVVKLQSTDRLLLPKEFMDALNLSDSDSLEFIFEINSIRIRKYIPMCTICGKSEDVVEFERSRLCRSCVNEITHI